MDGMKLSPNEIAFVAQKHWADKGSATLSDGTVVPHWVIAVAVFLAESGGDTEAMGRSTSGAAIGNRDHGLAQISNYWHQRLGDGSPGKLLKAGADWRDPVVNCEIAFAIWDASRKQGKDPWNPWHVYTSGSFRAYLPDGTIAVKAPWAPPAYDPIGKLASDLTVLTAIVSQKLQDFEDGQELNAIGQHNLIEVVLDNVASNKILLDAVLAKLDAPITLKLTAERE
jgi:hypothetical protein